MTDEPASPPVAGEWTRSELSNTGLWSIGDVWLDRSQGRYCTQVLARHCNAFGVMHGGAMATFADAQIVAVRPYTGDAADHTPTVTLSVDYLAPAPEGSWIVLSASALRITKTMIFSQALITIDEQIVARTNAIYRNNAKGASHG